MDLMLILQTVVLLGAIFLGIRLGGMAIGYAGGLGVAILCLGLGMKPGDIPWDVILIIMSVIACITAMQVAGGLDYLVQLAEKILRRNPKYINYLSPAVTYFLTLVAGTGHTAFSMIPVIVEVAKEQDIKPSAPLSVAVVSSQIAITASPVSAAVVYMTGVLEDFGWSYPTLLLIWIVSSFCACMLTAFVISTFFPLKLSKDPVYQKRLEAGLVSKPGSQAHKDLPKGAKLSVLIFLVGVFGVVFYATSISDVARKPMLNYVNSLIPLSVSERLDSIKTEAMDLAKANGLEKAAQSIESHIASLQAKNLEITNDASKQSFIKALEDSKATLLPLVRVGADIDSNPNASLVGLIESLTSKDLIDSIDGVEDSLTIKLARLVRSYIDPVRLSRDGAIMCFMLSIAAFIVILCRVDTGRLLDTSTFKSGMTACICVLGVAWLGNTYVGGYKEEIGALASKLVSDYPALLSVALFFASMLLYSQAATAKAIMPVVIGALGITAANPESSYILIASFAAVSALFVLPTYPTLLGAVQMDDTGSTRIGKYVFNHAFIIPGVLAIALSVVFGFLITPMFA